MPEQEGVVAPVVAAVAPVVVPVVEQEPHWLKPRLEREANAARASERAALLAEIGVTDPADAKKLVTEEQARSAAAKSLEIRASESETALIAERARVAALSGTVTAIAAERMASLPEAHRAAVVAALTANGIAETDSAAQLRTIAAFAPIWAAATPIASAVVPAVAPVVAPVAPASTAPSRTAPGGDSTSPVDHKAAYESLKSKNPFQAAEYLSAHALEIYPVSNSQ